METQPKNPTKNQQNKQNVIDLVTFSTLKNPTQIIPNQQHVIITLIWQHVQDENH